MKSGSVVRFSVVGLAVFADGKDGGGTGRVPAQNQCPVECCAGEALHSIINHIIQPTLFLVSDKKNDLILRKS